MGNPWGQAAESYGRDLDQYGAIQQQGMNDRANAPTKLYQMFMEGFEKEAARKEMERRAALQQEQLERQNRIADETLRHNVDTEKYNRERLTQADTLAGYKRAGDFTDDIDSTFTGDPLQVESAIKMAKLRGIPEEAVRSYFEARKSPGSPGGKVTVDPGESNLPNPTGEDVPSSWDFEIPASSDSYQRGTGYGLKKDAQDEAARRSAEVEKQKQQAEDARWDRFLESQDRMDARQSRSLSALAARTPGAGPSGFDPSVQLPPHEEVKARLIKEKKLPPQMMTRGNPRADLVNARAEYLASEDGRPGIDAPGYQADVTAKKDWEGKGWHNQMVNSINTVGNHIATLKELAPKLNNGDMQAWNKLGNALGQQFGNDPLSNYNMLVTFLAPEIAKLTKGGVPTLEEVRQAEDSLRSSSSPRQFEGLINTALDLVGGRANSLNIDHERNFEGKNMIESGRVKGPAAKFLQKYVNKGITGSNTGIVRMRFPDGSIRDVPEKENAKVKLLYKGVEVQ